MSPNLRPVLASPIGVSDHHSNSESWGWRVVQSRSSWAVARLQSLWNLWAIQFLQQCDGSNPSALQRSQQLMLQKVPWIPWVPRPAPLPCATWNAIAEWLGLVWWIPGKKCPKVDRTKKKRGQNVAKVSTFTLWDWSVSAAKAQLHLLHLHFFYHINSVQHRFGHAVSSLTFPKVDI